MLPWSNGTTRVSIHSGISFCACECANRTLSEWVPGVTQATVAP